MVDGSGVKSSALQVKYITSFYIYTYLYMYMYICISIICGHFIYNAFILYICVGEGITDMVDGSGVKSSALQVNYVTSNI